MDYTTSQNWATLIARILFALIFILSGINKIFAFESTVSYMQASGVTFYPNILAIIATCFELGGGILILIGFYTRLGAVLLFAFTLAVTFAIHHFWNYSAEFAQIQMINFMKNLAMLGGTLYIWSFGAGDYSLDAWRKK